MEINFENKSVRVYQESFRQTKRCQVSMDSVVPDVNDDIGRIASVQTSVFLKSKDLAGRGVFVSGEVQAAVLYITENGDAVSAIRLSREFDLDYELGESEESLVQIRLSVLNAEARVLNPRKLSLTVEVSGELSAFFPQEMPLETVLPPEEEGQMHILRETAEATITETICEKSFVLNEQFPFPEGKPEPSALLSQEIGYSLADTQQIGSRLIVKGSLEVAVCYLSEEEKYPLRCCFSEPFSQIIEIGSEECSSCTISIETTSAYLALTDGISGGKSLDAEIHAVMQAVGRKRQKIAYIADAYSNEMPLTCCRQEEQIPIVSEMRRTDLSADASLVIAEDCDDILCVLPSLASVVNAPEKTSANTVLDIIYRSQSGDLACVRRTVTLEGNAIGPTGRVLSARLRELSLIPEGDGLRGSIGAVLSWQDFGTRSFSEVTGVSMREDQPYDQSQLPSLSVVYTNGESLWELAKKYHSSVESIEAVNDPEGRMLLIPREI